MTSKCVAELLADLGIGRTHSRPHVSKDNPYSESAFKTKYCPAFPERFGSIADDRAERAVTRNAAYAANPGRFPPLSLTAEPIATVAVSARADSELRAAPTAALDFGKGVVHVIKDV